MSLIDRYVKDLFNHAAFGDADGYDSDEGLELEADKTRLRNYFNYATIVIRGANIDGLPDDFRSFLEILSPEDAEAVLLKFIDKACEALGWLDVTIFSAIPLTAVQRAKVEAKLENIFGKEMSVTLKVDPLLIGGLRVIAGDAVLDNTIKTRLAEMRKNIYKSFL